ncbi:MAG: Chaperone protein Skp precursor [Planctomycetes bacterium ADurb.Bin401]|nr:MAG: Chaperone protein Skp precursor [Planctomycetes bacterium ADurb.Bin401]
MKKNLIIAVCLAALFVLAFCVANSGGAKEKPLPAPRIAIVSVRDVFDNCTLKVTTEKELAAEGESRYADIKKMESDIESEKNAISKLKEDSAEYMVSLKSLMMKQSQLEAEKEFYQQDLTVKEMRSKEKIYRKILESIAEVAKEKGYNMVINRDDNYLNQPETSPPAQNPTDLILTTRTHKLLYFDKEYDMTQDVLVNLNNKALQK